MWKADIHVTYKDGILEPQGSTIHDSLTSLGFKSIHKVKVGKLIEIEFGNEISEAQAREEVETMCRKLLANVVMERFSYTIKSL